MFDGGEAQRLIGELVGSMTTVAAEALGTAAGFDLAHLDDDVLCDTLTALESMRRTLDATVAHALVELAERKVTEQRHGLATSTWLARESHQAPGVARHRLRAALAVARHLPVIDQRLRDGRLGWHHVEVFARALNPRNADALHDASPVLCDLAEQLAFDPWRDTVLAVGRHLDPDGTEPGDRDRSHLTLSPSDVLATLHGTLVGHDAVIAHQALNAKADELFRAHASDRDQFDGARIPCRSELMAQAFIELCRQAQGVDPATATPPRTDATLVIHTHHSPEPPPDPATPTEAHFTHPPAGVVTTPNGHRLPDHDAALLLCDTTLTALGVTPTGRPLTDTHPTYRPTRRQRRALEHRDGGCTFPGCTTPATWTDAHHLEPWPTGPTTLANLALVCRRHHRLVHQHHWTLDLDTDGWTTWTSPRGQTRSGQRHQRTRAGP